MDLGDPQSRHERWILRCTTSYYKLSRFCDIFCEFQYLSRLDHCSEYQPEWALKQDPSHPLQIWVWEQHASLFLCGCIYDIFEVDVIVFYLKEGQTGQFELQSGLNAATVFITPRLHGPYQRSLANKDS
jgi:hypothetical protein